MTTSERKEKQLLEAEAASLARIQDAIMHAVASMSVMVHDEPTDKAKANAHRFQSVSATLSEASGAVKEAQRRLGNAIATY